MLSCNLGELWDFTASALGGSEIDRAILASAKSLRLFNSEQVSYGGVFTKKLEPILRKISTNETETMRTKFCGNNFLGKGFRKTSADSFFLNLDVASGGGGVWGGILRLLLLFLLAKFGWAFNNSFSDLFCHFLCLPSSF